MQKEKHSQKNIVLIGMMGCGKTTIARILGKRLNKPVIDIDEYIEETYQMTIHDMFEISEDYFRERETICCQELGKLEGYILSTGGGVIKNQQNIDALKRHGVIIYIDRPVENILSDIRVSSRPLLKEGPEQLYALFKERHTLYLDACDVHIDNVGSLDDVVEKILIACHMI